MKRKGLTLRQKEIIGGLLFISPWIIGFLMFFVYNMVTAVVYSFHDIIFEDLGAGGYYMVWQGFGHFHHMFFVHATFTRQLVEALIDLAWELPLIIFFSLFIAMLLNRKFPGRGAVRVIYFLPVILASPAIAGVMRAAMGVTVDGIGQAVDLEAGTGGFNQRALALTLMQFGVPFQILDFLLGAIARLHDVIRMSGVQILIFLSALQSIPSSLYEVSQIEGATPYEAFWKITLPMVSPFILTNIVFTMVNNFAESPIMNDVVRGAFPTRLGPAAAMTLVTTLVLGLFMFIVCFFVSRKVFYQT